MKAILVLALVASLAVLAYGEGSGAVVQVVPAGTVVPVVPVVPVTEVKKDDKPIVVDTKQQAQHGEAAKALADAAGKYFQNYVFINIKIKYLYIYFFCLFLFFIYRKSGRRA